MRKIIALFFVLFCFASCKNLFLIEETDLYRVSFETNGGTSLESYRTDKIDFIPTIQKEDATFAGWYTPSSFSGTAISFPFEVSDDVTLYAKWIQNYSVSFETNGGSEIASYKSAIIAQSPYSKRFGYTLLGWYTQSNFAGEAVTFPFQLTAPITLHQNGLRALRVVSGQRSDDTRCFPLFAHPRHRFLCKMGGKHEYRVFRGALQVR